MYFRIEEKIITEIHNYKQNVFVHVSGLCVCVRWLGKYIARRGLRITMRIVQATF